LSQRGTVDPSTDDFVHPIGTDLFQALRNAEVCGRELFFTNYLAPFHLDDPHLRGEVKARGNPIFINGNGYLHGYEFFTAKGMPRREEMGKV
jgi:hypothetical protein